MIASDCTHNWLGKLVCCLQKKPCEPAISWKNLSQLPKLIRLHLVRWIGELIKHHDLLILDELESTQT